MTITNEQIEDLQHKAAQHADASLVDLCDLALAGDEAAIAECAREIELSQQSLLSRMSR